MACYDISDADNNNLVGHYASEEDALRLVRDLLPNYGDDYANKLHLEGRDDADRVVPRSAALSGSQRFAPSLKVRRTVMRDDASNT